MGLTMRGKQAVARQNRDRYRQASKREKTLVLNEFVQTTGYNRKYALRVLGKRGMPEVLAVADGKPAKLKPEKRNVPKTGRAGGSIPMKQSPACARYGRFTGTNAPGT